MVRRAASVLALAAGWSAFTAAVGRLQPRPNAVDLAVVGGVALPLAAGVVIALATGFHGERAVLVPCAVAGGALAVGASALDLPTPAGLGKLLAAGALGLLLVSLLERPWHAAGVAVLVVGIDIWSVFAGPTRQLLEAGDAVVSAFTVPLSAPGAYGVAGLGVTDFLFLGVFCGAALRWRLRPALTLPLCAASFSASFLAAYAADRALPALPLLALAFVVPNLDRFRPGAPDRPLLRGARPATLANARRNASARIDRRDSWRPARDACWALIDPLLAPGASVAIVGAGNADDLPLTRIAARAGRVDLLDVDPAACRASIRREPRSLRSRLRALEVDASGGHADRICAAVVAGRAAAIPVQDWNPLGDSPYDLVIGDLLYSQLLYPALRDADVTDERVAAALATYAAPLTGLVVSRLHASARSGLALHLHDPVAWWPGREQPFALDDVLRAAGRSAEEALAVVATGSGPAGSDPRDALAALGVPILRTAFWRWPFARNTDYLVCATIAASGPTG